MQKRVPIFNTMFSELHRYPRYEVRLDTVDPVPRFVARQWRGQQRYKTFLAVAINSKMQAFVMDFGVKLALTVLISAIFQSVILI